MASHQAFQAMTMLSPTGPGLPVRRKDQHRNAGLEERPIEHAARMVAWARLRARRNHQVDAMGEKVALARFFRRHEDRGRRGFARRVREHPGHRRFALRLFARRRRADVDSDQSRLVGLSQRDGGAGPLHRLGGRIEKDEDILVRHCALPLPGVLAPKL